ncbi:MAG TPA: hypothetical protein VM008_13470 [Phycisphaerae bacterium]|nr:hypothetical protein [Phycisphaerae bacterium]
MASLTPDQVSDAINKLSSTTGLSAADCASLKTVVDSMATTIRAQDIQIENLQFTVANYQDADKAEASARMAALNALRAVAPPTAKVDVDAALEQVKQLRTNIDNATTAIQTTIAIANFAVSIAAKFLP